MGYLDFFRPFEAVLASKIQKSNPVIIFPLHGYYFHSFAVRRNKNLVHHAMRWFWQKEREGGRREGS